MPTVILRDLSPTTSTLRQKEFATWRFWVWPLAIRPGQPEQVCTAHHDVHLVFEQKCVIELLNVVPDCVPRPFAKE